MVASKEIHFIEVSVGNVDGDSVHLHKLLGKLQFHFCVNISSQLQKADLLEFAVPEIAEVVSGRKNFKTAAKSVGKQTLKKQLGERSRKRTASRVTPTKSTKQIRRSRRDISNISHQSCRAIFGTNFLWQFLEILEEKSQ